MAFITASDVRRATGAPTSLITDSDIESVITIVEAEVARFMNTKFEPTERIDVFDGNNTGRLYVMKNPLLSVRSLTVNDGTSVTPAYLHWSKSSGKVLLGSSAESATFTQGDQNTVVKYLYGMLEESSTSTTTTAASTAGTSVSLSVSSESGFADEDWVEVYGTDGHREVAQVNADPTTGVVQVDQLVQAHASGSTVVKLQIPYTMKRYMEVEAGIYIAVNAIGGTYAFNTSYSLGELSVNKGEPYPQWREVITRLLNERKMLQNTIRIRPAIAMG